MKYVCAIAISLLSAAPVLAAPVIVTNSNSGNWAFDTRDGSGSVVLTTGPNAQTNYVNGPATPPLGTGSAHLATLPGAGDGAAELRNTGYAGIRLDALTSLSYSTYSATNNGQQFPYWD